MKRTLEECIQMAKEHLGVSKQVVMILWGLSGIGPMTILDDISKSNYKMIHAMHELLEEAFRKSSSLFEGETEEERRKNFRKYFFG